MIDCRFRPIEKWPGKETADYNRRRSPFGGARYPDTLDMLERELRHLDARDIVIQAGFDAREIRNDGWPRSSARPKSPGVIVSFRAKQTGMSFPCDTFLDWEANLRAIARSLEALRMVDRYGVTRNNEQYKGWSQIAAPAASNGFDRQSAADFISRWSNYPSIAIRENPSTREDAYRAAARILHPDTGGNHEQFVKLQQARAALLMTP